jgi:hypothetical protein
MSPRQTAPAFQCYPRDILADSRFIVMTPASRGVLFTLLLHAWLDGSVPDDPRAVAALLREPAGDIENVWPQIVPWFERRDGRLVYTAHEEQRARHVAWRDKCRKGGRRSGEVRRSKGSSTSDEPTDGRVVELDANTAFFDLRSSNCDLHAARESDARAPARSEVRPGHQSHALCSERLCLTAYQLEQFARGVGGDYEQALAAVETWARRTMARYSGGDWKNMPIDTPLKTWDRLWEATGLDDVWRSLRGVA